MFYVYEFISSFYLGQTNSARFLKYWLLILVDLPLSIGFLKNFL